MNVVHAVAGTPSRDTRTVLEAALRLGHGIATIPTDPLRATLAIAGLKADIVGLHGLRAARVTRRAVLHADAPVPGVAGTLVVRSESLASRRPGAVVVVPAGDPPRRLPRAEARRRMGIPQSAPAVGVLGPGGPEHERLVEAMAWVDNDRKDVWLAAIGGVDSRLRGRADHWGIGGRLAEAPDDTAFLSALDVLFVPDGSVSAALAGMASGVPVVAVTTASLDGVMADLVDGLLVPGGDGEAWSRALLATIRGADRARDRAERARERAAGWTLERTIEALKAVYSG